MLERASQALLSVEACFQQFDVVLVLFSPLRAENVRTDLNDPTKRKSSSKRFRSKPRLSVPPASLAAIFCRDVHYVVS